MKKDIKGQICFNYTKYNSLFSFVNSLYILNINNFEHFYNVFDYETFHCDLTESLSTYL